MLTAHQEVLSEIAIAIWLRHLPQLTLYWRSSRQPDIREAAFAQYFEFHGSHPHDPFFIQHAALYPKTSHSVLMRELGEAAPLPAAEFPRTISTATASWTSSRLLLGVSLPGGSSR